MQALVGVDGWKNIVFENDTGVLKWRWARHDWISVLTTRNCIWEDLDGENSKLCH